MNHVEEGRAKIRKGIALIDDGIKDLKQVDKTREAVLTEAKRHEWANTAHKDALEKGPTQ